MGGGEDSMVCLFFDIRYLFDLCPVFKIDIELFFQAPLSKRTFVAIDRLLALNCWFQIKFDCGIAKQVTESKGPVYL